MVFPPARAAFQFLLVLLSAVLAPEMAVAAGQIDVTKPPYSAPCNGGSVAADSIAIANAVAAAQTSNLAIYIPAGATCSYNNSIVLTRMIPILGDGPAVSKLRYCGSGDAIHIDAPTGDNEGHVMRGFTLEPCYPRGGAYGIHVQLAVRGTYAYFNLDNLRIGDFGARGLWLNNNVNNQDGFFIGRIANTFISNGVLGTRIGDSIIFENVKVHGRNNVDLTGLPAGVVARLVQFIGGQVTTENGYFILRSMDGFRARDVWMERLSPSGWQAEAGVYIEDSVDVMFEGSAISVPSPSAHVFAMVGARDTKIINNTLINKGYATHIYGTSTTLRTRVEGNSYYMGDRSTPAQPVVVLQGS